MGPAFRLRAELRGDTGFEAVDHLYPLVLSVTLTRRPYEIVVGARKSAMTEDAKTMELRLKYFDLHDRLFTTEATLTEINPRRPFDGKDKINGPLAVMEESSSSHVPLQNPTTLETIGVSFSRKGRLLHARGPETQRGTPLLAAIPLEKGDKPLPIEEDPTLETEDGGAALS
jgi:hypothetical protein